jgi:hypothetical protein
MMDNLEGMGEVDFPSWWQSKITTAKNNISGAKHYLEFELKEPAIDAVVDRLSNVSPEMEIDEDLDADINVNKSGTLGDAAIDRESASGAFEENLDIEAKVDALQRLKRGEIDTLPSDEDAKAALIKRVLDKLSKDKKNGKVDEGVDETQSNPSVGDMIEVLDDSFEIIDVRQNGKSVIYVNSKGNKIQVSAKDFDIKKKEDLKLSK